MRRRTAITTSLAADAASGHGPDLAGRPSAQPASSDRRPVRRPTRWSAAATVAILLGVAMAGQAAGQAGYGRGGSGIPRVELPD